MLNKYANVMKVRVGRCQHARVYARPAASCRSASAAGAPNPTTRAHPCTSSEQACPEFAGLAGACIFNSPRRV
jgi:hypothetical protein